MRFFRPNESDPEVVTTPTVLTESDMKAAYERGRVDERARRRTHPILASIVFIVALIGAGTIYLAAREGSFSGGGQVVDHSIANATRPAEVARQDAGTALSHAGDKLQDAGRSLSQNPPPPSQ